MATNGADSADPVQLLDPSGHPREGATLPDLLDDELVELYRQLYFARRLDRRTVGLNRRGELGSYPPLMGHEAAQVGSAWALDPDDWIVPSYRDHAGLMVQGLPPSNVLRYYRGRETGNAIPEDVNVLPMNGSVATQIPHATGLAWAAASEHDDPPAVLCYFGDGATSKGDFHEALNFAGVFDTPSVFFCQNNHWAISTPRADQTASDTLARKADAYGIKSARVDGTDPLAVYQVTREALQRAKAPAATEPRPTLIEAVLYRLGAHSTADNPDRYWNGVPDEWQRKDPVPRFARFLEETGRLDNESRSAIEAEVDEEVDAVTDRLLEVERPEPAAIFDWVYDEVPARLQQQTGWLRSLRDRHGDEVLLDED